MPVGFKKTIDDLEAGVNNAFSVFGHHETWRCFSDVPALVVPALP